ncbi:MAG: manganese efflux pump [Clostridia bacterium]|nr:manganese efflux pump [Clostridia bacterium]
MSVWELLTLAAALAADAFAVSVCKGLSVRRLRPGHLCLAGAYFGGFQALMPLLGYGLGVRFEALIRRVDHWIAFGLLAVIGLHMILDAFDSAETLDDRFGAGAMLPLALATSIDALAVGVTFAFLQAPILPAVLLIGGVTFILSAAGVAVGYLSGARCRTAARLTGGVVLILMGLRILYKHLGPM